MINMFLITYEFSAIYVHCESVLATFGACISSACVVDVGYQKINVACVEEGVIVPNTLFRKNYGGEDLDMVMYRLCQKKHAVNFKKKSIYKVIDPCLYGDFNSI